MENLDFEDRGLVYRSVSSQHENLVDSVTGIENKVKEIAKKHPLCTAFIGIKVFDAIALGAAYVIWPDETSKIKKTKRTTP